MKPHDHKAIQQFEAYGRDHDQIHGSNVRSVVSQKSLPPLTGRSRQLRRFRHVINSDKVFGTHTPKSHDRGPRGKPYERTCYCAYRSQNERLFRFEIS